MKKKILIGSIIAVVVVIGISFISVVGYGSVISKSVINSPLFSVRTSRAIGEESKDLTYEYVNKGITLPFPKNDKRALVKKIINNLKTEEWKVEIEVNGGVLGYKVTIKNLGNETFNGSLIMNITTKSWIMPLGRSLKIRWTHYHMNLVPGEEADYNLRPVLGLGPAVINIEGEVGPAEYTYIQRCLEFDIEGRGIVILFFVGFDAEPIIVQGHDF